MQVVQHNVTSYQEGVTASQYSDEPYVRQPAGRASSKQGWRPVLAQHNWPAAQAHTLLILLLPLLAQVVDNQAVAVYEYAKLPESELEVRMHMAGGGFWPPQPQRRMPCCRPPVATAATTYGSTATLCCLPVVSRTAEG